MLRIRAPERRWCPIRTASPPTWRSGDTWRAMSPENVEVVRRLIDAFNIQDGETALSALDPSVEFESALIERRTYRGHAGIADIVRAWGS